MAGTGGSLAFDDDCCPAVIGEGCTNVGSLRYTSMRNPDGTISLIDSVSGAAVSGADIVPCPSDDTVRTLSAEARLLAAGQSWTPGGDVVGVLTSVTFTVLTGTANLTDNNGTVSNALPAGVTLTWSVEDDNILGGPTSIAAVGGDTIVNWTRR